MRTLSTSSVSVSGIVARLLAVELGAQGAVGVKFFTDEVAHEVVGLVRGGAAARGASSAGALRTSQ